MYVELYVSTVYGIFFFVEYSIVTRKNRKSLNHFILDLQQGDTLSYRVLLIIMFTI